MGLLTGWSGLLDRASANRTIDRRHSNLLLLSPNSIALMSTVQTPRLGRIPNLQFQVLVLGRANAGKTSILQRVCDTTESPTIYRGRYGTGRYDGLYAVRKQRPGEAKAERAYNRVRRSQEIVGLGHGDINERQLAAALFL